MAFPSPSQTYSAIEASQYPVFSARCSERDAPDWIPGVKANRCKTAVNCLTRNSSRHGSKVMSKLRSRCLPKLPYAK
ncbi:hypothetical protein TNCV_4072531 [Trichonephila clavipes]|uniref:Uncharacterized protein n=1 Tax=Trichonephila clavipes TaxID=2585209 RepID=A0A8X7BG05_TRICX|nr:hypothetical protein TNCV_4072531 [Trichonephila clavipes]